LNHKAGPGKGMFPELAEGKIKGSRMLEGAGGVVIRGTSGDANLEVHQG